MSESRILALPCQNHMPLHAMALRSTMSSLILAEQEMNATRAGPADACAEPLTCAGSPER